MKFKLLIFILASSCLLLSCNSKENNTTPDQTPKALDNETSLKEAAYSKRYASDIIQELYAEALTKDKNLLNIDNAINRMSETEADSMKAYYQYVQNNESYWASANGYINQLSDSSLKQEMRAIFDGLEIKANERMTKLSEANQTIQQKKQTLNNQHLLMKLLVTQPMMSNYQINELPKIKALHGVIMRYDSLIDKTKPYTVIKK